MRVKSRVCNQILKFRSLIKGDNDVEYPLVKKVLDILQDKNVNRFSLITSLEKVEVVDAKK